MTRETKKILVADDDVFMRDLLCYLLSKRGYKVISAINEEMVLSQLKQEKPDLIIFDYRIFQADGLDIVKKIKKFHQGIGMIILTSSAGKTLEKTTRNLGVDDLLSTRTSFDLFIKSVQKVFRRQELRENKT